MSFLIHGLQYANWSEKSFRQMREGGVDAVHVTITCHETFREKALVIEQWNRWFEQYPDLIFRGRTAVDVQLARDTGRTTLFFGAQNPYCIEDYIGLVGVAHANASSWHAALRYNSDDLLRALGQSDGLHDNWEMAGLRAADLDAATTDGVVGHNRHAVFGKSFGAQSAIPVRSDRAAE